MAGRRKRDVQAVSSTARRGPLSYPLSPELPECPKKEKQRTLDRNLILFPRYGNSCEEENNFIPGAARESPWGSIYAAAISRPSQEGKYSALK